MWPSATNSTPVAAPRTVPCFCPPLVQDTNEPQYALVRKLKGTGDSGSLFVVGVGGWGLHCCAANSGVL